MNTTIIKSPYKPFPGQAYVEKNLKRFNVVLAHRSWGKSYFAANLAIKKCLLSTKSDYRLAFVYPEKDQGRRVILPYLEQFTRDIPGVKLNRVEMSVKFPDRTVNGKKIVGGEILVIGVSEGGDNARGMHLDGMILDEVAQLPENAFLEILKPMLNAKNGWAIFVGTPKGHNYLYELAKFAQNDPTGEWAYFQSTIYNSGRYSDEWVATERAMHEKMGKMAIWQQEYELSFEATHDGLVFSDILKNLAQNGKIRKLEYDKRYPVVTAWDLGYDDYTVIWFAQYVGDEVHVLDCYAARLKKITDHLAYVKSQPYQYAYHILPWDAAREDGRVADTYANTLRKAGLNIRQLPRVPVMDGVNAAQQFMAGCVFDLEKTAAGREKLYKHHIKERRNGSSVTETVNHCDISDAFRYLALGMRKTGYDQDDLDFIHPTATYYSDWDIHSLD